MALPYVSGVDRRIQHILNNASSYLPQGYSIRMTSGYRGAHEHNHNGRAADYQIFGPQGALSNRGEDPTGMYTQLARHAYGVQRALYPELNGMFAWGGAFGTQKDGSGPRDLMHFDINNERGRYSQWLLSKMGSMPGIDYGAGNAEAGSPGGDTTGSAGGGLLGKVMSTVQGSPQPGSLPSVLANAMAKMAPGQPGKPPALGAPPAAQAPGAPSAPAGPPVGAPAPTGGTARAAPATQAPQAAPDTESEDTPASSDKGLLSQIGSALTPRFVKDPNYTFGDMLSNVGASMMALDQAAGAKVLAEQAKYAQTSRGAGDTKKSKMTEWSFEPNTGTFFRTNQETGKLETAQGAKKNQDKDDRPVANEGALKHVDETIATHNTLAWSANEAADLIDMIDSGELNLGAVSGLESKARNYLGISNAQSLAYIKYHTFINKLVNADLKTNHGVQTEGDAYRALQILVAGGASMDNKAARAALLRIVESSNASVKNAISSFNNHKSHYKNGEQSFGHYNDTVNGWIESQQKLAARIEKWKHPNQPATSSGPGGFSVVPNQPAQSNQPSQLKGRVVGQPF